uniref:Uncharacterized protein n=1 Tax=Plectus sambesii TaxID=2011161 RepID=A0A914UHX9_9BILA
MTHENWVVAARIDLGRRRPDKSPGPLPSFVARRRSPAYSEPLEVVVAAAANYGAFDRPPPSSGPCSTIGSYAVGAERHGTDDGRKCY